MENEMEEFDIWYGKYKHVNKPKEDYFLYETYGDDLEYILSLNKAYVWTLVDTDDGLYLLNGYHLVNRLNYIVCEIPHNVNDLIEYKYD